MSVRIRVAVQLTAAHLCAQNARGQTRAVRGTCRLSRETAMSMTPPRGEFFQVWHPT
jgi:hypothetical protein